MANSKSPLQGVVFQRARAFELLPSDVRTQVRALRQHLLSADIRNALIQPKTFTIQGQALLDAIAKWQAVEDAEQLVWGLVLDGFLEQSSTTMDGVAVEKEEFAVVDPTILSTTSVWSLKDGAIQAGNLVRKLDTGNSTVYLVANDKLKTVSVFASENARNVLDTIDVSNATVEFTDDISNGIKLSNATTEEVFGASSKPKQEEWLNSFLNTGATYREAFNTEVERAESFNALKDIDMAGNEVPMSKYKGKVVMVVNVSSNCGLTASNYPQLTELDKKYRDQGLQILAFPCNQFLQQEPGTDDEIMEFVKQYGCEFQFFQKKDVNGKKARPVFTYLKAKLPEPTWGPYIKWNFTKFLIDRDGNVVHRHAPKELPFTFEDEIKALLAQKPNAA